ncbi:MAG: ABC transporter ATP-binding protein [Chthonomonadaceae bacterium]|nr:ABC transporter ATP-binding protein [Chthonomonadaceae bacterium]
MIAIEPYEYGKTVLKAENVRKSYGKDLVLKDLSVEIKDVHRKGYTQGQAVALLGPSGVGKSTFFRLLAGLEKPDSGTILVEQESVPVERGMVGVIAQNYPLFEHRTVMSNLKLAGTLGGRTGTKAQADALDLLKRFGLAPQKDKYPTQLSGGQRQRVAIIQQLLCSDHFLLFDEPFSGLDPIAEESVCALIREMAQTDELKTFVIVTHDIPAALAVCDTVWLLGRERDEAGNPIPGSSIQKTYDLIQRGVAWRNGDRDTPEFAGVLREIREAFNRL